MTKDGGSDRPSDESDEKHTERFEDTDDRRRLGEEKLSENECGHRAIQQEVVPFDCRADRAGDDGTPELRAVFVGGQCRQAIGGGGHILPPFVTLLDGRTAAGCHRVREL
jgi:hypothetical protein